MDGQETRPVDEIAKERDTTVSRDDSGQKFVHTTNQTSGVIAQSNLMGTERNRKRLYYLVSAMALFQQMASRVQLVNEYIHVRNLDADIVCDPVQLLRK